MYLETHFSSAWQPSKDTLRPILERAVWSLNLALEARRPPVGMRSQYGVGRLATARAQQSPSLSASFAVTEVRGDWKWIVELFQLTHHWWKAGRICFRCEAARIPKPLCLLVTYSKHSLILPSGSTRFNGPLTHFTLNEC